MSTTYDYSLSTDFGGNLNSDQFRYEIIDDGGITTSLQDISTHGDHVGITFVAALSGGEVTALNNLVSGYVYQAPGTANEINLVDEKPMGSNGGTFTSGAWRTRTLNKISAGAFGIVTLDNDQFTLYPGSYSITVTAPAYDVGQHQCRLRNITDNVSTMGTNAFSGADSIQNSIISTCVDISQRTVYEIQHQCQNTKDISGFGVAVGFGEPEIYTCVTIKTL